MASRKELNWDLRNTRIQQLGVLVGRVREGFYFCSQERSIDSLFNYRNALDTLWQDIRQYAKQRNDENRNKKFEINGFKTERTIQGWLDYLDKRITSARQNGLGFNRRDFKALRLIDNKINGIRMDAGLDIPSSTKHDPDEAMVKGLNL